MKKQRIETRKVLLVLPLLLLPMLAAAFYCLGGGRGEVEQKKTGAVGLKVSLPDAKFSTDTLEGKMSVYEQQGQSSSDSSLSGMDGVAERLGFSALEEDPKVAAIHQRLEMLNTELGRSYEPAAQVTGKAMPMGGNGSGEVEKLERLMKNMQSGGTEDAEMKQLSGILERIQEIGDPELARLKYKVAAGNGDGLGIDSVFGAIPAVVDGNQKALQGSVVKLRLLDTVLIEGYLIPKGYHVYAVGSFSNQRLNLEIRNIRVGNSIIPVRLTVFDRKDAMVGINAPEALLSDAVRGGGVDAMGSFGMMGMDLTTQLAGAGIDAARGLLSKKLKRIRQPLKNGYPVLLKLEKR